MLDLVEKALVSSRVRYVRLDGSMTQGKRDEAIQAFKTNPEVSVFLISLKAGGVGLNLTAASIVYLCEPWWNPVRKFLAGYIAASSTTISSPRLSRIRL